MKKALSLLLSLLLVFSTISVVSFAEEGDYNLKVGGVTVTADNEDNVLGDGSISFDPISNTLTLKNACITRCNLVEQKTVEKTRTDVVVSGTDPVVTRTDIVSYTSYADSVGAYIYYDGSKNLHIKLLGENKIMGNDPDLESLTDFAPDGISSNVSGTDILFEGDGSLQIDGTICDGIYSNGGIKTAGQKFIIKTQTMGLHAMHRPLVIEGNTILDIDSMNGIYNRYGSIDICGGKIKILCSRYGIYCGKESEGSHVITISGGDIVIEEKTESFNPVFVGKDITISGGRIFSRSHWGLWSNGTIHVTGGHINMKAAEDGLLQTGENNNIIITGGTLILETEKGNAFSYKSGSDYPAQKPILDGYENVSIDYGSDFDHLVKGKDLESAEKDKYWESQVVIIRAKNDPQPKPRNTVVIEIGPMEQPENQEENPDTGAPDFAGAALLLSGAFLLMKRKH